MKRFSKSALAAMVLGSVLALATPAQAATPAFTISPTSGVAGTTITFASTSPCPAPPGGTTLKTVVVVILNGPGQVVVGGADVTPKPDGSWTGSAKVGNTRNGAYVVAALCFDSNDNPYFFYDPPAEFDVVSPPGQNDPAVRFAGPDRITTALSASQDAFPGDKKINAVVLSRSDSYADALAGTPLADHLTGPLLLTGRDSLDSRTNAEIERVLAPSGTIYVLGGSAAVGDAVLTSLQNSGYAVRRLAGANRYETAVKIAAAIGTPSTLLLATGTDFGDGLVAGAAANSADEGTGGGAVLLTDGTTLPAETQAYLSDHATATVYAVGSAAAAADPAATGIVGADTADTSRLVAERFFPSTATVAVASAANFPDALSGGVHAAEFGAPLLLTDPHALAGSVANYLGGNRSSIAIAFVYGGTAAVDEGVRSAIVRSIS
jgi:putative cell wall-binding protein